LLSKAEPRVPRYFTPEDDAASGVGERDAVRERPANGAELKRLRLGTVRGGSQLRERIMFRTSAHELGYYDDRRWTERPEVYLRRALVRVLFEERGLFHVVSGYAPALDVELLAFEVVRAPQSKVRVRVAFTLDNDRVGKVSQTITVEQALPSSKGDADAEAAVGALAVALKRCVDQIADSVMSNHASDSPPAGLAASPR
jgi:cholesterol transport system auxiliary component